MFPSGLDAHDSEHFKLLRLAYQEWQDNQQGARPEKAIHRAWVEFVLRQTLELPEEVLLEGQRIPPGLQTTVAEQGETLRPDWVIVNPQGTANAGTPRLLVQIVPAQQDLEKPLAGQRWKASPATRMMELLHANNVRLGLVTNGEHWMLVNAPRGETTGFISWYGTLWLEEHLTLRAFRSLLGVRRFFGVDDSEILETLLTQSISDQQEVTDQLGYQVRRAVEVLVQALDRIDQDRNRTLLQDISEPQLYEAALTVMMRLVFLFSAEERKLIPSAGEKRFITNIMRFLPFPLSYAAMRISLVRRCWNAAAMRGVGCWRRFALCMGEFATICWIFRPMAAVCSTRTDSRFWRGEWGELAGRRFLLNLSR